MNCFAPLLGLLFLACFHSVSAAGADTRPVTPDATPEARALLRLLYEVSGKHTLSGQHNYPNTRDRNSQFATRHLGRAPAIFGSDMGHAAAGDSDSYLARPDIVQECIRQHQRGAIVTLCWHAAPPTADEPVTFLQLPGSDPKALKSVQGKLLDEQFRDVLTPGTPLHKKWVEQVDAVAAFLKQLQDANVPVLWRPYHEMNGDWFWWGGRGPDTAALYRQMFERYVHHHKLRNLVWVWSVDRVTRPGMEHERCFPGLEYADVLSLDVYGSDFADSYYQSLERLSGGKPLALAEVGNPPPPEVLAKQPKWTFYMTWAGMVRNTSRDEYRALFADPRVVNRDDPGYARLTTKYRRACGLEPLAPTVPNFSGNWVIDEAQSKFGAAGASTIPAVLELLHEGEQVHVRASTIIEWGPDQVTEYELVIDGPPLPTNPGFGKALTTLRRGENGQLRLETKTSAPRGGREIETTVTERLTLSDDREILVIDRETVSPRGTQQEKHVYRRR